MAGSWFEAQGGSMTVATPDQEATGVAAITWFSDIRFADAPTVGGKGANLGELTVAGLRSRQDSW